MMEIIRTMFDYNCFLSISIVLQPLDGDIIRRLEAYSPR